MGGEARGGSFLGTGWGFPIGFDKRRKEIRMASEEDDILEALHILLSTSPGERVLHPDYGCGIEKLAFSAMTTSNITRLKDLIEHAVLIHEPRVALDGIEVDTGAAVEGLVRIELRYTVRATNSRRNMVYPFYLLEGTDIAVR